MIMRIYLMFIIRYAFPVLLHSFNVFNIVCTVFRYGFCIEYFIFRNFLYRRLARLLYSGSENKHITEKKNKNINHFLYMSFRRDVTAV